MPELHSPIVSKDADWNQHEIQNGKNEKTDHPCGAQCAEQLNLLANLPLQKENYPCKQ